MTYKLHHEKKKNYVYFQSSGIRSTDTIVSIMNDIREMCEKHECSKVLIDVSRMTGKINTIEAYEIGSKKIPVISNVVWYKIAAIDLEENKERFRFFETVIRNTGVNLRFFTDHNEAHTWLLEE